MQIDVVVAGAGIWGCTVARALAEAGRRVLVLEKRDVVGGNVRCETDPETGIEVHTYGSHIFHTHLDDVWAFVRRFVEFNGYQHKVLAKHAGRMYFLPLGLTLVNQFYGLDLTPEELPGFIAGEAAKGGCSEESNFETQAISFIGKPLYDAFIREYTRKQWGTDPRNLSADIIRRLPVRPTLASPRCLCPTRARSTRSTATGSARCRGARSASSANARRCATSRARAW